MHQWPVMKYDKLQGISTGSRLGPVRMSPEEGGATWRPRSEPGGWRLHVVLSGPR